VTRTPSNGSAVYLVTWYRWRHVTIILHCHWLEFWWHVQNALIILSIISIKKEKSLNSNNIRSKLQFLRLLWDIVVLRLVAHLLNMMCLILPILYKILHIYVLEIIFTQFYSNFSRQEHQIYVSINSRDSQVSAYTPFHFSFTVPLMRPL